MAMRPANLLPADLARGDGRQLPLPAIGPALLSLVGTPAAAGNDQPPVEAVEA